MDMEGEIPDLEDYQAYLETNEHLRAEAQPPQTSTRDSSIAVAAIEKARAAIKALKLGQKLRISANC
jgi:hypothetical protein